MNDLRLALRQLFKSPGFTIVAVLTLALGIGACAAIFSVVNSVLLRPIEYPESDRLVVLRESRLPQYPVFSVSPANFRDWTKEAADVFESMYAQRGASYNLTGSGDPVRVNAARVTGGYFETLRSTALLGRVFGPAEDEPGKGNVVVLSYGFWQKQFGGRKEALGETMILNGQAHAIIGVMPASFQRGAGRDLYAPMAFSAREWEGRGGHYIGVVARLKPGITIEQARSRMATIAAQLAQQYPDTNKNWGSVVTSFLETSTASLRNTLYTLLAAVAVLLLIACANVANLLLARSTARQREISVRAALGASRWRVVRLLLVESLVLALLGGGLGVLVGKWGLHALLAFAPSDLPRAVEISLDGRALFVTLGVTLFTAISFGLVPAWQGSRINLVGALKEGARGASDSGHRHLIRHGLVVAEIALALMLLTGAGLLMRNFAQLAVFDPGFDPHGGIMVKVDIPREKYPSPEKQAAFVDAVIQHYRSLPGVTSAGATHVMPLSGDNYILGLEIEGRDVAISEVPNTNYFSVTPDYFKAAGIRLLQGRMFTDQDRAGGAPVAIVSKSLVEKFFPGADPIGKRIFPTNGPRVWREIVGVVGEVKLYGIERETAPQSYTPFAQTPFTSMTFVVRTSGDPNRLAPLLRSELYAVDPDQPVSRIDPLDNLLTIAFARQRFAMTLFGVFSALALILAAIGIYGVMAYAVSQRTSEFGIRLALGAQPRDVFRLVLGHGARLIGLGVVCGILGALAAARFIESMLYQTPARDPLVFTVIAFLLAAVALLACVLPALRATKVDPMVALRAE